MKINPQTKMDIGKVVVITLAFVLITWFLTLYNHALMQSDLSNGFSEKYDIRINLLVNTVVGLMAGILGGTTLVVVNNRLFRKRPFGYSLVVTMLAYTIVFGIITLVATTMVGMAEHEDSATTEQIIASIISKIKDPPVFTNYILWGSITFLTLFLLQVNDKFGPGILRKFLLGKYFKPREEQRIFMFLDMKSSTTIAERIGNTQYFNLLQDVFADITNAIIASDGEIYQYVGDEIIITWTLNKGIAHGNCLRCFSRVHRKMKEVGSYYEDKYGVIPKFKAGVHHGNVTAGEIGSIKKDIIYSGDVLNTTARIQEQCNFYDTSLLVSGVTLDLIEDKDDFGPKHLGNIELRGRQEKIDLNTIRLTG